jgi:uncharacterized surface protein with fasciclin (FAS1) repeats
MEAMARLVLAAAAASLFALPGAFAAPADAQAATAATAPTPARTIVETAAASPVHTTLVAAVKAAGLVETLSGPGPFTVFAPTDAAFGKLPAGTVDTLVRPASKAQLTGILTYHVVPGRLTAADLQARLASGRPTLKTVQGGTLTVRAARGGVEIVDATGKAARVTAADLTQSNGVILVVDTVLTPG